MHISIKDTWSVLCCFKSLLPLALGAALACTCTEDFFAMMEQGMATGTLTLSCKQNAQKAFNVFRDANFLVLGGGFGYVNIGCFRSSQLQ